MFLISFIDYRKILLFPPAWFLNRPTLTMVGCILTLFLPALSHLVEQLLYSSRLAIKKSNDAGVPTTKMTSTIMKCRAQLDTTADLKNWSRILKFGEYVLVLKFYE